MASLRCLWLLLALSTYVAAQNSTDPSLSSSASDAASSASDAASSASDAASSASSLESVGSSTEASSFSSIASSISSIASSFSSEASSISTEILPTSTSESTSTSFSSSSSSFESETTTETASSVATSTSESTSVTSESTSETSTSTSESSFSPTTLTSTSTSVEFSSSTVEATQVVPTTSDGVVSQITVTTFIVSSSPATTYVDISPYTTSLAPGENPTTQADSANSGGSGGLSTGAKVGIGVGVGLAVVAAALFGWWYSWYMRRKRRRSISASDRYPPSSIPSMSGMMGGPAVGYNDKSDTRSELPSPPIGGPVHHSPRSPDYLLPTAGGGVRSWNSTSSPNVPPSSQSVSDYSERGGQPPPDPSDTAGPGYFAPPPTGLVHEMGDSQHPQPVGGYQHQQQPNPQQNFAHSRTVSGGSHPSELGEGTFNPQTQHQHQRTFSSGSQSQQHTSPVSAQDAQWHDAQPAQELHGSAGPAYIPPSAQRQPGEGYRGVDPEVPLHQRMQNERVPVRVGHLQKQPPGNPNLGPSHNF